MRVNTLGVNLPLVETETTGLNWNKMYRVGAVAALVVVLTGLVDVGMMFIFGNSTPPGERTVLDWFNLLQSQPFLALRDMGLLNMVTTICSVLIFFALFGMHRRIDPLPAALALILACIGAAVYIGNNTALPMLTLSQHYAPALTADQKALWTAAGQALLAQEDLTAGAFPGFLIAEAAGLIMAWVALRGGIFRRWQAWLGIIALLCLVFFNVCAAFIPALYDTVMPIFGAGGGLLSLVWYALIARHLFQPPAEQVG